MEETNFADEFDSDRLVNALREEESLFARGEDDALMRYVKPTSKQFEEKVTIIIDGEIIKIPKARPRTDALGNPLRKPDGSPIPRDTTIYDAALELVRKGKLTDDELHDRIPVLCHQRHLEPVGVCRMCSVHVSNIKRGKFTGQRKLVPACQHRVEDKMSVLSRRGPKNVSQFLQALADNFEIKTEDLPGEQSVRKNVQNVQDSALFLTELLSADHLSPDEVRGGRYRNELNDVAKVVGIAGPNRFSVNPGGQAGRNHVLHAKSRPIPLKILKPGQNPARNRADDEFVPDPLFPYGARSIHVDHDRCILCDRCVRSCSDVKPFKVIGHTGKGYRTRISFDFDQIMSNSSCVQCGECMTSCPTGALTLNRRVVPMSVWAAESITDSKDPLLKKFANPSNPLPTKFLTADELLEVRLHYQTKEGTHKFIKPFEGIPYAFLRWNEGAVWRRELRPGVVLCTQGHFDSTAFLLIEGEFDVEQFVDEDEDESETNDGERVGCAERERRQGGLIRRLIGSKRRGKTRRREEFRLRADKDLILGEIACLTNGPRTATVTVATPSVVLEVTRNMLAMLQRNPTNREILGEKYCERAIRACLINSKLFKKRLGKKEKDELRREFQKTAEIVRVAPGEKIVAEGDRIGNDETGSNFRGDFYIIVLGFMKVSRMIRGQEQIIEELGPERHFGEIALLPDHPKVAEQCSVLGFDPYQRTATCTALSDMEVVRIPGTTFRQFFRHEPEPSRRDAFSEFANSLADDCVKLLKDRKELSENERVRSSDYLHQGLYQSQKMLVLDLLSCTRCDECTKACADAHGDGHSRLLREGLRFGDFLVAASCRSCFQPYCMDGCPVDAIHRIKGSKAIRIEEHCIGCSLCERNCPYGSIQMIDETKESSPWSDLLDGVPGIPSKDAAEPRRALNCDLCETIGKDPFCVSACPHKAAFRWSGDELRDAVKCRES